MTLGLLFRFQGLTQLLRLVWLLARDPLAKQTRAVSLLERPRRSNYRPSVLISRPLSTIGWPWLMSRMSRANNQTRTGVHFTPRPPNRRPALYLSAMKWWFVVRGALFFTFWPRHRRDWMAEPPPRRWSCLICLTSPFLGARTLGLNWVKYGTYFYVQVHRHPPSRQVSNVIYYTCHVIHFRPIDAPSPPTPIFV